jgi:hypothetical protein
MDAVLIWKWNKRVYPVLVDAMQAFLHGSEPDLTWIHGIKLATP